MTPHVSPAPAAAASRPAAEAGPLEIRYAKDRHGVFHTFGFCPVVLDGVTWDTAEHFILATRAGDDGRAARIWAAPTARAATREAAATIEPAGWAVSCTSVIRRATEAKVVQHPRVAATLLATGQRELLVHCGHDGGSNVISAALMHLRDRLPQMAQYTVAHTSRWIPADLRGRPWVLFGEDTLVFPPTSVSAHRLPTTALRLLTDAAAQVRGRRNGGPIRAESPTGAVLQRGAATQKTMAAAAGEDITYVWLPDPQPLPSYSRYR